MATRGHYITMLNADCITWSFCPAVSMVEDALESIYSIMLVSWETLSLYWHGYTTGMYVPRSFRPSINFVANLGEGLVKPVTCSGGHVEEWHIPSEMLWTAFWTREMLPRLTKWMLSLCVVHGCGALRCRYSSLRVEYVWLISSFRSLQQTYLVSF